MKVGNLSKLTTTASRRRKSFRGSRKPGRGGSRRPGASLWTRSTRTRATGRWTSPPSLRNVKGAALHIGSPTTEGRPLAGYGGLFWRGPRSFDQGEVITAAGHDGPDAMGQAAAWMAYMGRHDGSGNTSTLAFLDHPANLRYPNKWFVRQTPYACASFAFMFDEVYEFQAEETLALRYRLVIANGGWDAGQIEAVAAGVAGHGGIALARTAVTRLR